MPILLQPLHPYAPWRRIGEYPVAEWRFAGPATRTHRTGGITISAWRPFVNSHDFFAGHPVFELPSGCCYLLLWLAHRMPVNERTSKRELNKLLRKCRFVLVRSDERRRLSDYYKYLVNKEFLGQDDLDKDVIWMTDDGRQFAEELAAVLRQFIQPPDGGIGRWR